MVKNMDLEDFRAIRRVLEPDDFAVTDGKPAPPPTDLVDYETWDHVMTLPGHVAITTTSYQGSKIALLHELSSEWIFSTPMKGITGFAMSAIWDNLESSIFNTIHGYYKMALAILRVALETSVVAARCAFSGDQARWGRWKAGAEFKFGNVCDEILRLPDIKAREDEVVARAGVGIFKGCAPKNSDAWIRSLYSRLCRYSHARGDATDASIWRSNGPVYSADGLKLCYETFLEIYVLVLILAKWSHGRMGLKRSGKLILLQQSLPNYIEEPFRAVTAYYRDWLWKPRTGRPRRPDPGTA